MTEALAALVPISTDALNAKLTAWGHAIGPCNRVVGMGPCHGLEVGGELVAVTAAAELIRERCAGLDRSEAVELARLCASNRWACRVMLRLWREVIFPTLGRRWAVSYQDRGLHTGNLYRFDGWQVLARSRSGTDPRSGRQGRSKVIWGWCRD